MRLGPDERAYLAHVTVLESAGARGLREYARAYLFTPAARDYPSPIRWGWALCLRASERAALFLAFVCAGLTFAASPLLVHLARRRLQDTTVAALTLACLVAAEAHGDWSLALAFAALLALKPEGAALAVPAIAWTYARADVATYVMAGAFAWACVTAYVFRGQAWPLVKALAQPHDTAYGREHQRGMPHRLVVDFVCVSPVWCVLAAWYHPATLVPACLLVAAHACTPVRNVRTVLAADLAMRAALYGVVPAWAIALAYVYDAWVVWRARGLALYDTPTDELVRATCKSV